MSDHWTLEAMRIYGGGFVQALAVAARCADDDNLARIKKAWPEYWARYEDMGKALEARDGIRRP